MKKYLFAVTILLVGLNSQAQAFNFEMLGTDSVEFYVKLDSAIKATPDFGFTLVDTALLAMQIFQPETLAKLTELFSDSYEKMSNHMEGGWVVVGMDDSEKLPLI